MPGGMDAISGTVQDTLKEGNTLPQTDETDHDGNHDRQQTQNFIQNTAHL